MAVARSISINISKEVVFTTNVTQNSSLALSPWRFLSSSGFAHPHFILKISPPPHNQLAFSSGIPSQDLLSGVYIDPK
jgi:hypothetical protein